MRTYSIQKAVEEITSRKITKRKAALEEGAKIDVFSFKLFLEYDAIPSLGLGTYAPITSNLDLRSFSVGEETLKSAKSIFSYDKSDSLGIPLILPEDISKSYIRKICVDFYKGFKNTQESFYKTSASPVVFVKASTRDLTNSLLGYTLGHLSKERGAAELAISVLYYYCVARKDFFNTSFFYLPLNLYTILKEIDVISFKQCVEGAFSTKELELIVALEESFPGDDSLQKACDSTILLQEGSSEKNA